MATGSNNKEEEVWEEEDLQPFVDVLCRIFEVITTERLHTRVKSIHPEDAAQKAGSEHTYKTFVCTYESDPEETIDDPMPPGYETFRAQLAMTDTCDNFCALMEGIVREIGQSTSSRACLVKIHKLTPRAALFGLGFRVHWVKYRTKPKSVLVTKERVGKLKNHFVLRVTLPNGLVFIFDGSSAQYDWNFHLVRKDVYEAEYAQSAADAGWKYPGFRYPFVVMTREEKQEMLTHKDYPYWTGILKHLKTFVGQLKWSEYRGRLSDEVKELVSPVAFEPFGKHQDGSGQVQI